MKRIYVGGTFDLFHAGHVEFFIKAKAFGDYLIVSLNTDEFAARYKRKPIMTLSERISVVSACKYVDSVVVNIGCEDSKPSILCARPDIIVHGDDWTGESLMKQMGLTYEFMQQYGLTLQYVPYTQGISTSELLKRI